MYGTKWHCRCPGSVHRTRPSCSLVPEQERRTANNRGFVLLLILVENHSINHHVVPCANVVDSDWNADFHFRPYDIFIEHLPAPRHVSDSVTKMVSPRAAAFLKHDDAARSVLRNGAAAFRSGRCRSSLRNLRPGEGSCDREGYTK